MVPPAADTAVIKDRARSALLDCLDEFHGRKLLVLDPSLAGQLSLVVAVRDLQDHGVDQWFKLQANALHLPESTHPGGSAWRCWSAAWGRRRARETTPASPTPEDAMR